MWNGYCSPTYGGSCSSNEYYAGIPFGNQTEADALFFEDGFKGVRGGLLEGHYLVFEANGHAVTNPGNGSQFTATAATAQHEDLHQRWVLHQLAPEGTQFTITSALDGKYVSQHTSLATLASGAETYTIEYLGGSLYSLQKENGDFLNLRADGSISIDSTAVGYNVYSVTYHS
jgi:phospholipase C